MELYDWQTSHCEYLLKSLRTTRSAIDLSDMGIGKTVCASWIAKQLGLPVVVVSPKPVLSNWKKTLKAFGIGTPDVINYESLRTGRLPIMHRNGKKFKWGMDKQALIIFDECHLAKSYGSLNGAMLMASKPYYVLMLSATAVESPLDMQNIGYILDLYQNNFYMWAMKNGVRKGFFGGLEFYGKPEQKIARLQKIHEDIKPRMSRISIKALGDRFPSNVVYVESYDLSNSKEIEKVYKQIENESPDLFGKIQDCQEIPMVALQKERQKIELLKLDYLEERTKELLAANKSVIIFVNYRNSLAFLKEKLQAIDPSIIIGDQTTQERNQNIEKFQSNKTRVCISTLQSGGTGISLHDVDGEHARVCLVSPSFDARVTYQALGRAPRAVSKSATIQYVVYTANTIEERICAVMREKLKRIGIVNGNVENKICSK